MITNPTAPPFVSVGYAADRLGVPSTWLHSEAAAGRVPAFRAGKRLLMDLDEVRRTLVRRSVDACSQNGEAACS